MSSCSERRNAGAAQIEAERAPLIRLLMAMAEEWAAIADEVGTLGSHVARATVEQRGAVVIHDLQAFDTIGQRAHGQAKLLTKLARKIAGDPAFDPSHLPELLAHIPFENVRANLKAACHGTVPVLRAPPEPAEDAVDWF